MTAGGLLNVRYAWPFSIFRFDRQIARYVDFFNIIMVGGAIGLGGHRTLDATERGSWTSGTSTFVFSTLLGMR